MGCMVYLIFNAVLVVMCMGLSTLLGGEPGLDDFFLGMVGLFVLDVLFTVFFRQDYQ